MQHGFLNLKEKIGVIGMVAISKYVELFAIIIRKEINVSSTI